MQCGSNVLYYTVTPFPRLLAHLMYIVHCAGIYCTARSGSVSNSQEIARSASCPHALSSACSWKSHWLWAWEEKWECKREYKKNIRFTFDPDHHIFLLQTHQIIISALISIVRISGSLNMRSWQLFFASSILWSYSSLNGCWLNMQKVWSFNFPSLQIS